MERKKPFEDKPVVEVIFQKEGNIIYMFMAFEIDNIDKMPKNFLLNILN